jgi:hypothetical protein
MRVKASELGLDRIRQARKEKGWDWNVDYEDSPLVEASKLLDEDWQPGNAYPEGISGSTWRRFLEGKERIDIIAFKAFCQVIEVNWDEVVDPDSNIQLRERAEKSNFIENFWVGRESLIAELSAKLRGDCRVLVLTGITGIGKTALAYQLGKALHTDGFKREKPLNFEDEGTWDFVSVAADLLIRWGEIVTADDRKEPERLLYSLLQQLQNNRYLVQMDSLEKLLQGDEDIGWNNFQDNWWVTFFQRLLAAPECRSRLILTSQDLPTQFQELGYAERRPCEPLTGLNESERLALFQNTGIDVEPASPNRPYVERIGTAYEGHPLALVVIAGEILSEPFYGDVLDYWNKHGKEIKTIEKAHQQEEVESADDKFKLDQYSRDLRRKVKERVEMTFGRLAKDVFNAYVLLCEGAVYRRPVPEEWWLSHLEDWDCDEDKQLAAMDVLRDRYLVEEEVTDDELLLRQHNLIRSVALVHLKNLTTRQQSA